MPTKEEIVEKALQQLMAKAFEEKGMSKSEAGTMAKAAMIGLKKVDEAVIKADAMIMADVKKVKRKLNDWQKYVKANKNKFKYKSGTKKGQINLKAMSKAFKKTPAGRRKKK